MSEVPSDGGDRGLGLQTDERGPIAPSVDVIRHVPMEGVDVDNLYSLVIERIERPLIELTLKKTKGNQIKAADILGINRNTLRKKISDLGIELKKDPT